MHNSGVNGDTTINMLDRINTDVISYAPYACLVMAGVNDINTLTATASDLINRLTTIYTTLITAGIKIIASTILPSDYFWTEGNTVAKQSTYASVNSWIKNYAATHTNEIILCDLATIIADPATGRPITGWTDSTHPYGIASIRMGAKLANTLFPSVTLTDTLPTSNLDATNKLTNGLMLGNTAGLADSYGINIDSATFTKYKESRTDGKAGEWQVVDITAKATNNVSITSGSIVHGYSVGDKVYSEVEFEVVSGTCDKLQVYMFFQDVNYDEVFMSYGQFMESAATPLAYTLPISGILKTPPVAVITGAIRVRLYIQFNGVAKFRFGRCRISKV